MGAALHRRRESGGGADRCCSNRSLEAERFRYPAQGRLRRIHDLIQTRASRPDSIQGAFRRPLKPLLGGNNP